MVTLVFKDLRHLVANIDLIYSCFLDFLSNFTALCDRLFSIVRSANPASK